MWALRADGVALVVKFELIYQALLTGSCFTSITIAVIPDILVRADFEPTAATYLFSGALEVMAAFLLAQFAGCVPPRAVTADDLSADSACARSARNLLFSTPPIRIPIGFSCRELVGRSA